jgi:hypothetical protein
VLGVEHLACVVHVEDVDAHCPSARATRYLSVGCTRFEDPRRRCILWCRSRQGLSGRSASPARVEDQKRRAIRYPKTIISPTGGIRSPVGKRGLESP